MSMRMCVDTHINLLSVKLQSLPVCFSLLTQVYIVFFFIGIARCEGGFWKDKSNKYQTNLFCKKKKKTGRPVVLFSRVKCRCPAVPPTV